MKRITSTKAWYLGALLLIAGFVSKSNAASTATINISVSISATKSVSVNTTFYVFGALNLSTTSVATSSITVTNNSGGFIETYTLQGANATADVGGESNWTLNATSTGTNQYRLGAMFSSARPNDTDAAWDSTDYLTTSAQTCSTTAFGDGSAGDEGATVLPTAAGKDRSLWFRMITPDVSSGVGSRTAPVVIAIQ